MNQEFVPNINNRSVISKSNAQPQGVNSRPSNENKEPQAFSSELGKQIEKQETPKAEQALSVKPSQQPEEPSNKQSQKAEKSDPENGKILPDGALVGENTAPVIEIDVTQVASLVLDDFEIDVSQVASQVLDDIGQGSDTGKQTSDTTKLVVESEGEEQNSVAIKPENKPVIDPVGLIKNQELHAVAHQIKEQVTTAKATDSDVKNQVGKIVSGAAQKISVAAQGANNKNSENKQQDKGQEKANIRPDILQALSVKPATSDNTTAPKENKFVLPANGNVLDEKLSGDKQLKLPDVVKQEKLSVQSAGPAVDRTASGFGSTLASLIHGQAVNHTEKVIKADSPTLDIQPSLQSKAWSRVLSSRVVWMAKEGIQQASLKLNPANLGPVEVKISMNNDTNTTNVTFIAQHAATRDALEQSLPRLRESFAENGLELANADVSS